VRIVRSLSALSLAFSVFGCAIHPLPDDVTRYSTVDIVEKIRCEARVAIREHVNPNDPRFKDGGIGYDFAFTITENNNGSGKAKFSFPFTDGKFSVDLGFGEDKQRQSERKFIIVDTFAQLRKARCGSAELQEHWRYPITGSIGLSEVVATFVRLDRPDRTIGAFTDTLVYKTRFGGTADPKIELNAVANQLRLTEASASLAANREDIHKVRVILKSSAAPIAVGFVATQDVRQNIMRDLLLERNLDNSDKILDLLRGR
jgi:hypothetical protein